MWATRFLLGASLGFPAACGSEPATTSPSGVAVSVDAGVVRVASSAAVLEIDRERFRWSLAFDGGAVAAAEGDSGGVFYERGSERHELGAVRRVAIRGNGVELAIASDEGREATASLRFETPRTVAVEVTPPEDSSVTAVGDRVATTPDERIYGLTERLRDSLPLPPTGLPIEEQLPVEQGSLDRKGETVEMYVRPTFSLYAPFFQSSRGYGLLVDGTAIGSFDVAKSDAHVVSYRFETASTSAPHALRFHLFVGPEHAAILDAYTRVTGRPFAPPDWAFRHWRWRDTLAIGGADLDGHTINAQVAEDVTRYEALAIPAGVYLIDRPWMPGNFGFARVEWDPERLPNAPAMLASLRARGYRVLVWSSCWMCGDQPGDDGFEAFARGYLAPRASGPPLCSNTGGKTWVLDVTNPKARDWWRAKLAGFVRDNDIDGLRLDRGEEFLPSTAGDVWADGRNGREVHNDYPRLQAELHRAALADVRGDDTVLWSRPGWPGTQSFAVFGGGDYPGSTVFGNGPGTVLGLRAAIIAQQRAAFMGYPIWGSDGGGNYEFKQRDVFARWIEYAAFSGIMVIGGTNDHAPWKMPTEPSYDEEMIEIYRRYARLRERMIPYLASAARDAAASGLPIARPMPFLDRADPRLFDLWDEYGFGPDLLVAPVWRDGERARSVYFPAGSWRSLWDESRRYVGPATQLVEAPLDTIPVYIRGDAPTPFAAHD